jgi:hypothetical protein
MLDRINNDGWPTLAVLARVGPAKPGVLRTNWNWNWNWN